jgi:hypothetical protein
VGAPAGAVSCGILVNTRLEMWGDSLPKIAIIIGSLLIVLGGGAYIASGPGASPTALIPAVLGVLLAVAGLVGLRGGGVRRHAMHTAAAVVLLSVLGSAYQLIARPSAGSQHADIAPTAGVLNLALCAGPPCSPVRRSARVIQAASRVPLLPPDVCDHGLGTAPVLPRSQ